VNRQQDGSIANISAKDVRILKSGDIDETVNLDPGKAFHLAGMAAQKELVKAGANLRNFRFSPTDSRKRDVLKRLKEAQMDARVADTAMRYFDPRFKLMQESPKMVILPGSNNLHYEIKVGLGIFHVNAKSGEVKFVRDVIVN
jgi:hypothetical protein